MGGDDGNCTTPILTRVWPDYRGLPPAAETLATGLTAISLAIPEPCSGLDRRSAQSHRPTVGSITFMSPVLLPVVTEERTATRQTLIDSAAARIGTSNEDPSS